MLKQKFFEGGTAFMGFLTVLLIITTAWFIYQFVVGYYSKQISKEKTLRMIGYGRYIGLFAMMTGLIGQMVGLISTFDAIQAAADINSAWVFGGVKVTYITPIYGTLIFMVSLILYFISALLIENKFDK